MKKFLIVAALVLACASEAQAGNWCRRSGYCSGLYFPRLYLSHYNVRPSFLSRGYYPGYYYQPTYYAGGYYSGYSYSSPVIYVKPPKPRPNLPVIKYDEEDLLEIGGSKFVALRELDQDKNRVRIEVVSIDYHSDTGAVRKVKFIARWSVFQITKDKSGKEVTREQKHDTSFKLKFDEYGRFEKIDD